jgi:hypothetical protein
MSESEFTVFKYTCKSIRILESSCQGDMAADRQDCECCSNRGEPLCAGCHCIFWPFTIIIDILTCTPRYISYKCYKNEPTVVTEQPKIVVNNSS